MSGEEERVYVVEGMTCAHCRAAVAEKVGALDGVSAVHVDLASGRLTVGGDHLDDGRIAAAVGVAGYTVRP